MISKPLFGLVAVITLFLSGYASIVTKFYLSGNY